MVDTKQRPKSPSGWEIAQLDGWRSRKFRLGVALFFLGTAVFLKFAVIVLSIIIGEGSITYLTGPLLFVAFFMTLAEYDRLAVKIAYADAKLLGSEVPRSTRRWVPIFGWVWGVLLGTAAVLFVVAIAMREPGPDNVNTSASTARPSVDSRVGPAISPTTTIDRILERAQANPSCDSILSRSPGDHLESTCVYAASSETWHSVTRWSCRGSRDVYYSVTTADDFSMVWYAASYDTTWTLMSDDERPQAAAARCRPDDYNPDLPTAALPGVDQWLLYTPFDATTRLRVHAVSLRTGEEKIFLPSSNNPTIRYGDVVVAPDADRVAYVAGRSVPRGDVFVIDSDGTESRQVNNEPLMASQLRWTKDGTGLIAVSAEDDLREYVLLDLDTGASTLLFSHSGSSELVGVLDDAVVVRTYDGDADLMNYHTVTLQGSVRTEFSLDGVQNDVVIDPGVGRLLFSTDEPAVHERTLRSASLTDGTVEVIGPNRFSLTPVPSPDGEFLAFGHGDAYPLDALVLMPSAQLSQSPPPALATLGEPIAFLTWAPDGNGVVVGLGSAVQPGSLDVVYVARDGSASTLEAKGVPLGLMRG